MTMTPDNEGLIAEARAENVLPRIAVYWEWLHLAERDGLVNIRVPASELRTILTKIATQQEALVAALQSPARPDAEAWAGEKALGSSSGSPAATSSASSGRPATETIALRKWLRVGDELTICLTRRPDDADMVALNRAVAAFVRSLSDGPLPGQDGDQPSPLDEHKDRSHPTPVLTDEAVGEAPPLPEGWKAVPIEPTLAMMKEASIADGGDADDDSLTAILPEYGLIWAAMLAASPPLPTTPGVNRESLARIIDPEAFKVLADWGPCGCDNCTRKRAEARAKADAILARSHPHPSIKGDGR